MNIRQHLLLEVDPITVGASLAADTLYRKIIAAVPDLAKDVKEKGLVYDADTLLTTLCYLVASTRSAVFIPTNEERKDRGLAIIPNITATKDPALIWQLWLSLPEALRRYWQDAFNEAQSLFDTDPAAKPESQLLAGEQAALADKQNPLASEG